jgi:hypothetical protein
MLYGIICWMRSALFWDLTHPRMVVFFTDFSGQPIGLVFRGQDGTGMLTNNVSN